KPGEQVFVLDASHDGLSQIAQILAENDLHDLEAIHIVSHGSAGRVVLGATSIDDNDLASHAEELSRIGASLTANGDLLLYGCDLAQGDAGRQFIADLSRYTQADIAAATHPVGSAELGASWTPDAWASEPASVAAAGGDTTPTVGPIADTGVDAGAPA